MLLALADLSQEEVMSNEERSDRQDPPANEAPEAERKTTATYDESMTEGDEANAPDFSHHEKGGDEHAGGRPTRRD
jgi:hypothetical protein